MPSKAILITVALDIADGWKPISAASLVYVGDVTLKADTTGVVSIRFNGGAACVLTNDPYPVRNINLSLVEVSSSQDGVKVQVIGNTA